MSKTNDTPNVVIIGAGSSAGYSELEELRGLLRVAHMQRDDYEKKNLLLKEQVRVADVAYQYLHGEHASLQSRLQASEGERKENLQLAQMLTSDLQSCQSENEAFRTRIAELEKLCQEAAEHLDVYHNEIHIVKSACNTCNLIARLQSAQPGSEKEAR